MNSRKNEPVRGESTPGPFVERSFVCQAAKGERIEIRLSVVSLPGSGPAHVPDKFEFEFETPAGALFGIGGAVQMMVEVPLVSQPGGVGRTS